MPHDPNWPQRGEKLTSFQLREQWNSVAALAAQPGSAGPAGPQGEVISQQLTAAIGGTANNPTSVGAYTGDFSDPPTQSEMRAFRDWANSFFGATARQ